MKTKSNPDAIKPRIKKIVSSGQDSQLNHREDFKHCPDCNHPMENDAWDNAAVILVLNPSCYKSGCVSVISECPKCFALSWVHERMNGFDWNDAFPQNWKDAVKTKEASVKLEAVREWGYGICYNCKHLESASIEYHAWRSCIIGSGPTKQNCEKYSPIKEAAK